MPRRHKRCRTRLQTKSSIGRADPARVSSVRTGRSRCLSFRVQLTCRPNSSTRVLPAEASIARRGAGFVSTSTTRRSKISALFNTGSFGTCVPQGRAVDRVNRDAEISRPQSYSGRRKRIRGTLNRQLDLPCPFRTGLRGGDQGCGFPRQPGVMSPAVTSPAPALRSTSLRARHSQTTDDVLNVWMISQQRPL